MTTASEFANDLRGLADLYDRQPNLRVPANASLHIFVFDKAEMAEQASALGRGEKSTDTAFVNLTRRFGSSLKIIIAASHEDVCEKKVVGTRTVTRPVVVDTGKTTTVEEEIVEWICPDSFLSPYTEDEVSV